MATHVEGTREKVKGLCGAMLIGLGGICSGVDAHEEWPHLDAKHC